jgi:hypothetical protein
MKPSTFAHLTIWPAVVLCLVGMGYLSTRISDLLIDAGYPQLGFWASVVIISVCCLWWIPYTAISAFIRIKDAFA